MTLGDTRGSTCKEKSDHATLASTAMRNRIPALLFVFLSLAPACARDSEEGARRDSGPSPPPAPAPTVDLETAGTITGVVRLRGAAPEATRMRITGKGCSGEAPGLDVLVHEGRVANAFVYLREGLGGGVYEPPKDQVVIDQKSCVYLPRVVGAQVGQEIVFLNSDPTLHNVHTVPRESRGVNFGMPVQGSKRSIHIDQPEVMVPVKCDIHPWMRAYVGVLPHPYFAVTGADGRFRIGNVPPGEYVLESWHERFGTKTARVSLERRGSVEVEFEYREGSE